jgi:tRNA dimethylallyltransferase
MSAAAPLAAIVGPTASGKSELAMALAPLLDAEILVADSRQVYRGMDIGTAKPSVEDRSRVAHHLVDLVDPDVPFSVADWTRAARRTAAEVTARGRLPLLVGGTGLYISSLVDGHDYESQPHAPEKRATLAAELEAAGLEALAGRLSRLAPSVAARTDLRNPRRVLRALERIELTGAAVGQGSASPHGGPLALIGLNRPREVLYRRIDARAATLFAEGLLDEVRRLLAAGFGPQLSPMTGHGYGEAARHLAGEWSLETAVEVTARRTRQYAKRQLTWFRRDARIAWLDAGEVAGDDADLVAEAHRTMRRLLPSTRAAR